VAGDNVVPSVPHSALSRAGDGRDITDQLK